MSGLMAGASEYFQQGYDKGYEDALKDVEKGIKENGVLGNSVSLNHIINGLKNADERKE